MGFERKSNVKKDSNIEYENLTEGEHEARLVYVADCGMQLREYKGEVKTPAQQIALCFEVLGSTVKVDDAMFKAFVPTAQEDTVADWKSVLGNPVNIIIKHFKKDADTTYDNVAGLSSIPSKYRDKVPPAITTDFSIAGCEDSDEPAIKNLFGLAKFIHDKRINGNTSDDKPVAQPVSEHEEFEMNESLPF